MRPVAYQAARPGIRTGNTRPAVEAFDERRTVIFAAQPAAAQGVRVQPGRTNRNDGEHRIASAGDAVAALHQGNVPQGFSPLQKAGTLSRSGSSRNGSTACSPAIPRRVRASFGRRAERPTKPLARLRIRTNSTSGWRASCVPPSRCRRRPLCARSTERRQNGTLGGARRGSRTVEELGQAPYRPRYPGQDG